MRGIAVSAMGRVALLALALLVVIAAASSTAEANAKAKKGKSGKGKKPPSVYVFKGEIAEVGEDSVIVEVEKGNKFARSFAGEQVEFAVSEDTRIVKDDVEATLAEVAAGDEVVVKARAPLGATSFTAEKVVAETPEAGEPEVEEPEDEVTEPEV